MKLEDISIICWLKTHDIKNEKGEPIDFKEHRFLFDIYRDESPNIVCMKAAQVGMSTCEVLRVLWLAAKRKMDFIYTLPTDNDVKIFVGGKVNRIIAQNPILQEYTQDKDTIEQKQVGNSMIYYRGTWSEKAAIMVTADCLIHDEKDSSKQDVVDAYEARLQHSKFQWKHVFSHPSVPGHGVAVEWELSDQKHWFIKCADCQEEQFLEWPDSIDPKRKIYVCKYCQAEIKDRRNGRWRRKYLNRKYSGYLVNLLMCPWVSAEEILDKYNRSPIDFFYNKVLGLPYEGEGNTIPRHIIQRCILDVPNSQDNVVIGCDSGLIKHYVVGNTEGIFKVGETEKWEDIEAMLRRYPRSVAILDALPDLTAPREMREKFPGRVYLGNFTRDHKTMQICKWGTGKEEGNLSIDRHRAIQYLVDEFYKGYVTLNGRAEDFESLVKHFENIYRVKEMDSKDRPIFTWKKKNTEDHKVMAMALWRCGMDRFSNQGGKIIDSNKMDFPVAPTISPDGKLPATNPKTAFDYEKTIDDWRI